MGVKIEISFETVSQMSRFLQTRTGSAEAAYSELLAEIKKMDIEIQRRLDELKEVSARLATVEESVRNFVAGVPALIQDAIDKAKSLGVTSAQLAAFDELNARIRTDAEDIAAALVTTVEPAPVEPPADDTVEGSAPADTLAGGAGG